MNALATGVTGDALCGEERAGGDPDQVVMGPGARGVGHPRQSRLGARGDRAVGPGAASVRSRNPAAARRAAARLATNRAAHRLPVPAHHGRPRAGRAHLARTCGRGRRASAPRPDGSDSRRWTLDPPRALRGDDAGGGGVCRWSDNRRSDEPEQVARLPKSLANPHPRTPAMAAGVADHIWTYEEIAALLD